MDNSNNTNNGNGPLNNPSNPFIPSSDPVSAPPIGSDPSTTAGQNPLPSNPSPFDISSPLTQTTPSIPSTQPTDNFPSSTNPNPGMSTPGMFVPPTDNINTPPVTTNPFDQSTAASTSIPNNLSPAWPSLDNLSTASISPSSSPFGTPTPAPTPEVPVSPPNPFLNQPTNNSFVPPPMPSTPVAPVNPSFNPEPTAAVNEILAPTTTIPDPTFNMNPTPPPVAQNPNPVDPNIPASPPAQSMGDLNLGQPTPTIPSQPENNAFNPADTYAPSAMPTPQSPQQPAPANPTPESIPTDLSHLINNTGEPAPVYTPPIIQPETLVVPSNASENTVVPNVPSENEHRAIPKWAIGIGIGLLLAVLGTSAYFILGIGQNQQESTSLPAIEQQTQQLVPPPVATPISQAPAAEAPITNPSPDGSGSFGQLEGTTPTQPAASSAAELLLQRQQQNR